jgi:hypothetical protein
MITGLGNLSSIIDMCTVLFRMYRVHKSGISVDSSAVEWMLSLGAGSLVCEVDYCRRYDYVGLYIYSAMRLYCIVLNYAQGQLCQSTPLVTLSKAWVCGRSFPGTAVSNPAVFMDVSLLWMLCCAGRGLCDGPIPRPEGSYRVWTDTTITLCTYSE